MQIDITFLFQTVISKCRKGSINGIPIYIYQNKNIGQSISFQFILRAISKFRALQMDNVIKFYGLITDNTNKCVLSDTEIDENLLTFIEKSEVPMSHDFKLSLLWDISFGMAYLHKVGIVHGNLSSKCCVIDSKWQVKIADYWINDLTKFSPIANINTKPDEELKKLLWTAPELLKREKLPSFETDIFSFGIIVSEIITEEAPYMTNVPVTNRQYSSCFIYIHQTS